MKSVLVLGSSGLLGTELTSGNYFQKYNVISQSLNSKTNFNVNLEDYSETTKMLKLVRPDLIINLVSLTNVDHCERFPNEAYRLNVKTVENLVCAIKKCITKPYLIHISTDQVYDSEGLCEEKNVTLSNYYAFSKFSGELLATKVDSTILRTNFFGKSKNLKRASLTDWLYNELLLENNINVFEDIWFNPLSMSSLCKMIELVAEQKVKGIFNLGSNNGMNKADFAFHFIKTLNLSISKIKYSKVSKAQLLKAYRPRNMITNLTKFESTFNVKLPTMIDEIELVTKEYLK
jgi:dTDP-4-dehydrorhamnose reductase